MSAPLQNPMSPTDSQPDTTDPLVTLEEYRILMGFTRFQKDSRTRSEDDKEISVGESSRRGPTSLGTSVSPLPPPSGARSGSTLPLWLRFICADPDATSSIYFSIRSQESHTWRLYYLCDWLIYGCMIVQLIISGVLILLGALMHSHHVAIVVLGAVNGILTGILSLMRGQALPNRLMQYADGLRRVREAVEWTERQLRTGLMPVHYSEVIKLRDEYETCREDEMKNHPSTWTSGLLPSMSFRTTPIVGPAAV